MKKADILKYIHSKNVMTCTKRTEAIAKGDELRYMVDAAYWRGYCQALLNLKEDIERGKV